MDLDLDQIFQAVKGQAEGTDLDKVAADQGSEANTPTDEVEKLAAELRAGGQLFGDAAADTILQKLAEAVPAGGAGNAPRSAAEQIAEQIAAAKGKTSAKPGDDTSVRAEKDPTPGAQGVVNPATPLG